MFEDVSGSEAGPVAAGSRPAQPGSFQGGVVGSSTVSYGSVVPVEPGAVDPIRVQILAAARAARAGMAPVVDPAIGELVWVHDGSPDEVGAEWGDDGAAMPVAWGGPHVVPPRMFWPNEVPWWAEDADAPPPQDRSALDVPDSGDQIDQSGRVDHSVQSGPAGREPVGGVPEAFVAATMDDPAARVESVLPAGIAKMPGGAELAQVVAAAKLPALGAYELVEHIAACERVASAMHALQAKGIAELGARQEMRPKVSAAAPVAMSAERVTGLEVGARLARDDADADGLVFRAKVLTEVLTDTFAAWAAGWIDTERATLIANKLGKHPDKVARAVEAKILPGAGFMTLAKLRRKINRALARELPDRAKRHQEARATRFVKITPAADGMAWIEAYVSAEDAAAVEAVLAAGAAELKRQHDAADSAQAGGAATGASASDGTTTTGATADATTNAGAGAPADAGTDATTDADPTAPPGAGTLAQRRADVLVALAWSALSAGQIGGGPASRPIGLVGVHRHPVAVHVTVPITTLLGVDDEPAELAGFGPITAEVARKLGAHGTWRRILTDPATGAVLDYGRTRYTPPADLVDHVKARDGTCRWPGCDRPAFGPGVHLDHTIAWEDGGHTVDHNLGVFCEKNHVDKHHAGWQASQPTAGVFEFVSPTGHHYTTEAEPVGPVVEPNGDPDPVVESESNPPPF